MTQPCKTLLVKLSIVLGGVWANENSVDGKFIIEVTNGFLGRSFLGFKLINQGDSYILSNIIIQDI